MHSTVVPADETKVGPAWDQGTPRAHARAALPMLGKVRLSGVHWTTARRQIRGPCEHADRGPPITIFSQSTMRTTDRIPARRDRPIDSNASATNRLHGDLDLVDLLRYLRVPRTPNRPARRCQRAPPALGPPAAKNLAALHPRRCPRCQAASRPRSRSPSAFALEAASPCPRLRRRRPLLHGLVSALQGEGGRSQRGRKGHFGRAGHFARAQ